MIWSTLFQQMKRLHCLLSSLNNAVGCRVFIVDLQNMALENYCSSWKTISTPWYFLAWIEPIWNEDAHHLATIADDLSLAYSRLGVMQNLSLAVAGFISEYDSSSEAGVGGERCLQAWTLDPSSLLFLVIESSFENDLTSWLLSGEASLVCCCLALPSGSIDNHGIMASQS